MIEVFKKCMTTDFANFSGRARRREYWLFTLAMAIVSVILEALSAVAGLTQSAILIGLVTFISLVICIAFLIPSIAVTVRRLHDINKSGLWILIGLVPFVGALVLLVFTVLDGTVGENQYGPDPKAGEEV